MISCDITMNGYDSMTTEVVTQVEVDPGTEKAREELEDTHFSYPPISFYVTALCR